MCGIGGFVDYERDARRGGPILHGMKRTLTPRGPDAEGTYFDEGRSACPSAADRH